MPRPNWLVQSRLGTLCGQQAGYGPLGVGCSCCGPWRLVGRRDAGVRRCMQCGLITHLRGTNKKVESAAVAPAVRATASKAQSSIPQTPVGSLREYMTHLRYRLHKKSDRPERRPLEGARMRHQRPCRRPLRPERAALAWPCGRRLCTPAQWRGRRPMTTLPSMVTQMFVVSRGAADHRVC